MAPAVKTMPKVTHPGTAAAMIAVASSQVGYREGRNNDTTYGAWYKMNNVAWCAIFQSWAAVKSGCDKVIPRHAYTPSGAQWFKDRGQWGSKAKVGAIVYFDTAGMGRISHVGLVTKIHADGSFETVEGNTNDGGSRTGNGVYRLRRRNVGQRGGFGYPTYAKQPAPAKAATEKPTAAATGKPAAKPAKPVILPFNPKMKPRAVHKDVSVLKECLQACGYGDFKDQDGDVYGPKTQAAVVRFHKANPQYADSVQDPAIGAKGWAALQHKAAGRR